jgi:hypothetical protein
MTLDYNYNIYLWIIFVEIIFKITLFELDVGLIFDLSC